MKRRSMSSLSVRMLLLIVLCLTVGATRPIVPADAASHLSSSLISPARASGGTECVPVVFVHGITGSMPVIGSNWGFGSPQYPLFQLLEANGYKENETLFRFAYNWTQDNSSSAADLANYIEHTVKDGIQRRIGVRPTHVSIIAHSMGGLVTRRLLATAGTNGIDQAFTVGTPYGGAAEIMGEGYKRLGANLFTGAAQLIPTWQAVFDENGNPVANNGGFGYNTWVQTNVWPAPQPDVAFYSRSLDTLRTVTRTAYTVYDPELGPYTDYLWERRSNMAGDGTVDANSATTSVGSTILVPGSHAGNITWFTTSGRGAGGIVEAAAPQILSRLQSSSAGGPENCYPYKVEVTVTPANMTVPACSTFSYQIKVFNRDTGQQVQQLREHEEIDIRIFGSAMERETKQNTTNPNYSGTTPAVKRPGGVTVEARIMYRDVIPTFDGPPITIEDPLGEGYGSASASLDQPPTRQDRCGRTITAQFDEASCSWKWPSSNSPCMPDDNRSTASLPWFLSAPVANTSFTPQPTADNRSPYLIPASPQAATSETTRAASIAVLDNGFGQAMLSMLQALGLKADRLAQDFSPEIAARYTVLVIPTGGLSGYAQSDLMRARLAQYAQNGGVIVAFAQEYGDEFKLLPGNQLQGYGYDEDINCQTDSSRIATFAPMLLSQSRELVSLNVDGFFTRWPGDAQVLLNRTANGMPNMLSYRYGSGWVVATTAYPDMARYQGQSTNDETKFVRDLMVWALDPVLVLDRFGPNDTVTIPLTATNTTSATVGGFDFSVYDQSGNWLFNSNPMSVTITPGQTKVFTTSLPITRLLGVSGGQYGQWRVLLTLQDTNGFDVVGEPGYRFATQRFTQMEQGYAYPGNPYALSVTSESEEYPYNSPATFTYNVFNHSDVTQTFEVRWYMIHHSWYNVPGYSGSATVTVGPHSTNSVARLLDRVVDLDRVRASLYLNGQQVVYAERGFWVVPARLTQIAAADKAEYNWGDNPTVVVTTTNQASVASPVVANFSVQGPNGQPVLTGTQSFDVVPGTPQVFNVALPSLTRPGYYNVSVQNSVYGRTSLQSVARFYLAPLQATSAVNLPASLATGASLTLTATNTGRGTIPSPALQISLSDSTGAVIWSDEQTLAALPAGQSAAHVFTLNLPSIALGNYTLSYRVLNAGQAIDGSNGQVTLPASLALDGILDHSTYRVRDAGQVTLKLRNTGRFDLTPQLNLSGPEFGLSDGQVVALSAGSEQTFTYNLTVPADLPAGSHTIDFGYELGTDVLNRSLVVVVPAASIQPALDVLDYNAGESVSVALANVGGVDAPVTATLQLIDQYGAVIANNALISTILAGGNTSIDLTIPIGAAAGPYQLVLSGRDTASGALFSLYRNLNVAGVAAGLTVRTGQPAYFSDESLNALATVGVISGTLNNGNLNLRICSAVDAGGSSGIPDGGGTGGTPGTRITYVQSTVPISWTDISTTGSIVAQGDDTYSLVNLGFGFQFYGVTYTQMYVGSNGYVSFGNGYSNYANSSIPNPNTPNNAIYALWTDLYPSGGVYGNVYAQQVGPARYIVQWQGVSHCCSTGAPETFQIVLDGSDRSITLQYLDVTSPNNATAGVENADGSVATQLAYNQAGVIVDGLAAKFSVTEESIPLPTGQPYKSYIYTVGDVIFFSYADGSELGLYRPDGTSVWQGTLANGRHQLVNVPSGTYLATGSQKFAILGGDPIANGVAGYFASDQNGFGVSRELFTWTQTSYFSGDERFVVFAYQDNTNVVVADADNGTVYWSGTLNDGQHWATSTLHRRWLHITADKPVSAYTYYDQGSLIPAADGRWSGTKFYAYAGLVGRWPNDLNVMAFEDNTQVTIKNTDTGEVYWTGTVNSGQIRTEVFGGYTARGAAYLTVTSDKTVAVTVAPFTSYTSSYHMGFYAPDSTGSRIGTDIIAPMLSGGTLQVFAYYNNTTVQVYDSRTNQLVNTYTLNAGQSVNANPGYGLWRLRSDQPVSAWAGWGEWSAEFAPVLFGSIVKHTPFDSNCGFVLWEQNVPVTATATLDVNELVNPLNVSGKLILDGRLFATTGQQLAQADYPFYLFDRATALTLETDKPIYQPDEMIQISGLVTNTTPLTANMTLEVSANGSSLLNQPLTLAPGEGHAYTTSLTATTNVTLTASANGVSAMQHAVVTVPTLQATLQAPDVVGRSPFNATLVLSNSGLLPVSVVADFAGQATRSATLDSGQATLLQAPLIVTQSQDLHVTLSGDVAQVLTHHVTQGEAVALSLNAPTEGVWAGATPVPYTIVNTGLLPVDLPVTFTLDGVEVSTRQFATLPGETLAEVLWLDLTPGVHQLIATTPDQHEQATITVHAPEQRLIHIDALQAPTQLIGRAPVSVTVSNPGLGQVDGLLIVRTPFDVIEQGVSLNAGGTQTLIATLDSNKAPAGGTYTLTVEAWVNGTLVDQIARDLEVPGAAWQVTAPSFTLTPGVETVLPFQVRNVGGVGAPFTLTLDLDGLYAEEQRGWAGPGEAIAVTYVFSLPVDMEARTGVGHYRLNDVSTPFDYAIAGYRLDMRGDLSTHVARSGEIVTATIVVSDVSGSGQTIPVVVRLGGVGEPQTAPINLNGSAQVQFTFAAPDHDVLLSYGVYHPEGRSLLLDTLRLYVLGDPNGGHPISLYPDRTVYHPGDTVHMTALASVTGTLNWHAFNSAATINLLPNTPAAFDVTLPTTLVADTHEVTYHFASTDGRVVDDAASFEVDGDRAVVRQVVLDWQATGCTGNVSARIKVESRTALTGVTLSWDVVAPDGQAASAVGSKTVNLPIGVSWLDVPVSAFASGQAGSHRLHFKLTQGGRGLSEGTQAFDVGDAMLMGLAVPKPYYRSTWPVDASAALFNKSGAAAALNISIDGQAVGTRNVSGAGYRVEPLALGTLAVGDHTLAATLLGADGCTSQAATKVTVVPLPDITILVAAPDGLNGWHVTTPTISLRSDETLSPVSRYYAWNDGVQQLYVDNIFTVPSDGRHVLSAWAVANDGSASSVVTKTLLVDRQPPQITANISGRQTVTVTLVATDTTSGVDVFQYRVDGGAWQTYAGPVVFAPPKPLTVEYRARDRAGNWSAIGATQLPCELYPIALHQNTLNGAQVGQSLGDIFNGSGPGNFGWLSWTGANGVPVLAQSLTPYGDSDSYINPNDPNDHWLSIGDWVYGKPGVSNSSQVRAALDALKPLNIVVPVWDSATGNGDSLRYHVSGFARIQITDYRLPGQNRITATYRGPAMCP